LPVPSTLWCQQILYETVFGFAEKSPLDEKR